MRFSRRQKLAVVGLTLTVVVGIAAAWSCFYPRMADESDYGKRPITRSAILETDLKLMWETSDRASTTEAIQAAERVFATVELIGLSRNKVVELLGNPRTSSDSRYNFPFYPTSCRDLVYRFDSGNYGCQYNVVFGWSGKVKRVQYLAIE
jgi:hypothetical protein